MKADYENLQGLDHTNCVHVATIKMFLLLYFYRSIFLSEKLSFLPTKDAWVNTRKYAICTAEGSKKDVPPCRIISEWGSDGQLFKQSLKIASTSISVILDPFLTVQWTACESPFLPSFLPSSRLFPSLAFISTFAHHVFQTPNTLPNKKIFF